MTVEDDHDYKLCPGAEWLKSWKDATWTDQSSTRREQSSDKHVTPASNTDNWNSRDATASKKIFVVYIHGVHMYKIWLIFFLAVKENNYQHIRWQSKTTMNTNFVQEPSGAKVEKMQHEQINLQHEQINLQMNMWPVVKYDRALLNLLVTIHLMQKTTFLIFWVSS